MKAYFFVLMAGVGTMTGATLEGDLVLETTSPYHNIQVVDHNGLRTLSFDGSMETKMLLTDPLQGHFEYTEYFHMAWLWSPRMTNVLILGLGGGSVQRSFQHYYPEVAIDTVEIDPVVEDVAKKYFNVKESPTCRIEVEDGRVFLRRTEKKYDLIVLDAYVNSRYGSFIPYHLVTKEFFELARAHLETNGVVAYNVIGSMRGFREDLMGALYKTLRTVFPRVYLFPASDSQNVVLIATMSGFDVTSTMLHQRATDLTKRGKRFPRTMHTRINAFRRVAPFTSERAPILTDDYAPVDGLFRTLQK